MPADRSESEELVILGAEYWKRRLVKYWSCCWKWWAIDVCAGDYGTRLSRSGNVGLPVAPRIVLKSIRTGNV